MRLTASAIGSHAGHQGPILRWENFAYLPASILSSLYEDEVIEFDLQPYHIVGHDGLVWLLSTAQWRSARGIGPTMLHLPHSERQVDELVDQRFVDLFTLCGGVILNEHLLWRDRKGRQFPTTSTDGIFQLISPDTWDTVSRELRIHFDRVVAPKLALSMTQDTYWESGQAFLRTVRELVLNVAQHGGDTHAMGYGVASYRLWPRRHPKIRFVCSDVGPGFARTLSRRHLDWHLMESEAVSKAFIYRHLNPGVFGLYHTLPFVYELHGKLMIRTGDVLITLDLEDGRTRRIYSEGADNPSEAWCASIMQYRKAPTVRGVHIVIDLLAPGSVHDYR